MEDARAGDIADIHLSSWAFGGAITLKIGIHALFGFFIAGIMCGESKALTKNTRHVIAQMVRSVLVPLFFASIGLKIDFLAKFDLVLVLFIVSIGIIGRYFGAWIGVWATRRFHGYRHLIAIAHVPGGEMQIVIGILALEYGVISETVFVAIVFSAILSCVIAGPWMKTALRGKRAGSLEEFFVAEGLIPQLRAGTREEAIRELSESAAACTGVDTEAIFSAVIEREQTMGTAFEEGIAVPHARMEGILKPFIFMGRSPQGIEWNSPDGKRTDLIYMILTPSQDMDSQVFILRSIAAAMMRPENREALRKSGDSSDMMTRLQSIYQF